jgi:uncharacterized iron-regulated protein
LDAVRWSRLLRGAALCAGGTLACACAAPAPGPGPSGGDWESPLDRSHPLVGRLFDVARGIEIDEAELAPALRAARFVLLGESHENPDHHRLQARLLRVAAQDAAPPAVVLEMLRADQQPALEAAESAEPPTLEAIEAATDWDRSGWPPFALYAPIFSVALELHLPLVAGNLSAEERSLVVSGEPLPAPERARLGLDEPLPRRLEQSLVRELRDAHCGLLPESELPRMVRMQRAWDAALAQALLAAPEGEAQDPGADVAGAEGARAVLIAGAGHVRRDRGVPRVLAHLAPGADVVSLAFREVEKGEVDPFARLRSSAGEPLFDYVWYTPRASDEDYCDRIRKRPPTGPRPEASGSGRRGSPGLDGRTSPG